MAEVVQYLDILTDFNITTSLLVLKEVDILNLEKW